VQGASITPSSAGFEASAQGDLNGNGQISTIALTGDVNPKTGALSISTQVYISAEAE
jgi:hypothetical protein